MKDTKVEHVRLNSGRHFVATNGVRGAEAAYQNIAISSCRKFFAVTDYWAGYFEEGVHAFSKHPDQAQVAAEYTCLGLEYDEAIKRMQEDDEAILARYVERPFVAEDSLPAGVTRPVEVTLEEARADKVDLQVAVGGKKLCKPIHQFTELSLCETDPKQETCYKPS